MQSPTAIAFRALVMLLCLVSVPLLAIFGKDLPGVVKALVDGRPLPWAVDSQLAATGQSSAVAASAPLPAAPAFGSGLPRRIEPPPLMPHAEPLGPAAVAADDPLSHALPSQPGPPHAAALALPARQVRGQDTGPLSEPPPTSTLAAGEAFSLAPPQSDRAPPHAPRADRSGPGVFDAGEPAPPEAGPAQFAQVERRLRELGATYYLLETCGADGDGYRFFCKMGLGGSDRLYRCFQAVDTDPLRVMQTVLVEIEDWRGQRPF